MGGLNGGGDLMSLAPKCDMFLESLCQELSLSTKLGLTWLNVAKLRCNWKNTNLETQNPNKTEILAKQKYWQNVTKLQMSP